MGSEMNERIKSLIERAEYQAQKQSGSDWQVHVEPSREQIFEKFAELIVRECGEVAWRHTPETEELEYSHLIRSKILEHFGVKE
jgi:hypothetical protein